MRAVSFAPAVHAPSVGSVARPSGCTTSGVRGISAQLVATQIRMRPTLFVCVSGRGITCSLSPVHPLMTDSARDAIVRAASSWAITVDSMFRTLADQYVLFHSGACGLAARPAQSKYQSGCAVDLANCSSVVGTMGAAGCAHPYPGNDLEHFDCPGGDYRSESVRAFQRLWNSALALASLLMGLYGARRGVERLCPALLDLTDSLVFGVSIALFVMGVRFCFDAGKPRPNTAPSTSAAPSDESAEPPPRAHRARS